MRYWLVVCYVGHCGRRKNLREIGLAIEAKTCVDALLIAKTFPAVKHTNSKYLNGAREITYAEYVERRKVSAYEKALRSY